MRLLTVFARLFLVTTACVGVLFAAGMVGRTIPATIVAGRGRNVVPERLEVLLIDLARGITSVRHLGILNAVRVDWDTTPPQVLQRVPNRQDVAFTLSRLDFERVRLVPLLSHELTGDQRTRGIEIAVSGPRAALYVPTTGEVTLIDTGQPPRTAVTVMSGTTEPLYWSPDGQRLAIKQFRAAPLTLLDGDGPRSVDVFRDAAPVWSPDSRSVLLSQESFIRRNGYIRLYDAATAELHPLVSDLRGRSGTWCDSDTLGYVRVEADGSHTVQMLELATGQTTQILDAETAGYQDITELIFAPRAECDWLLAEMRNTNERASRFYRLHIPSGELIRLGENVRVLSITADALVYESTTANVAITVEAVAFESEAVPELYGRISAQNEVVVWFDDFRRGLFLRSGELWTLDLATGASERLPLPALLLTFQVVVDD